MKGLSLLEVVIVLAILSMMTLSIYSGASRTLSHQERMSEQSERLRSPILALMRISQDLKTAYIVKSNTMLGPSFDGELTFIGKGDRIDFVSFANQRYIRDAQESDSLELSYFLEQDPQKSETSILFRRQSSQIDKNLSEGGKAYPLLYEVSSLSFEYLAENSDEWLQEWDSSSLKGNHRLPRAIKVSLRVFYPTQDEEVSFSNIIRPELSQAILY